MYLLFVKIGRVSTQFLILGMLYSHLCGLVCLLDLSALTTGVSTGEFLHQLAENTQLHSLTIGIVGNALQSTWTYRAFALMTSLVDLR